MVRIIEDIFEKSNLSPLGIKLLIFLVRHPSEDFYLKELAESVGASSSGCHTALGGLLYDGLVQRRRDGGNVYWRANTDNPSLVGFKVFTNIQELRHLVIRIRDLSRRVVLYGSCATGEDTHESDIDILVVTDDVEEAREMLRGVHVNGRLLSPLVLTPSGLLALKEEDRALYDEVRKGIELWGGVQE
jgi:predicted nucleotidyltransferase